MISCLIPSLSSTWVLSLEFLSVTGRRDGVCQPLKCLQIHFWLFLHSSHSRYGLPSDMKQATDHLRLWIFLSLSSTRNRVAEHKEPDSYFSPFSLIAFPLVHRSKCNRERSIDSFLIKATRFLSTNRGVVLDF